MNAKRVRPHVARVLGQTSHVVIGFNGGICGLTALVPQSASEDMFQYMFQRGERFSVFDFLSDPYTMFSLAVERGHGEAAAHILHAAERAVAVTATATAGVADFLVACQVTGRPVLVFGGAANDVIEDHLVRQGLRHLVTAVLGRHGAAVPDMADAGLSLGAMPGRCAYVSDSADALYWAHQFGLLPIGFEGGRSTRKHLATYGPVATNLAKLALAVRAVSRPTA
jgi:beta-phosphoglucomutase-like phosphatase (HAD superfamily)